MASRRRLVACYSAFLVISIATALLAVLALHVISSGQARVAHQYTDELLGVERVRFQAERVVATARGYLMMRAPDYLDRLKNAAKDLDARVKDLRTAGLDPDSSTDLRAIVDDADDLAEAATSVANEDPHEVDRSFETMLRPQRISLQQHVETLAKRERASFEIALAHSRHRAERAGLMVAVSSAAGLVIIILLAIVVTRRLARLYDLQRKAIEEAKQAAAAREEVLSIVSHDLRSPLGTIGLASDLLVMKLVGTSAADEGRRQAMTIHAAAERMKHLVDQILEAAQIDAGTLGLSLEACDVGDLLRSAIDLFATRAQQASISLRCEPPDEAVIVRADKERTIEVLTNLIGNALKFTPAGGTVTVAAHIAGELIELDVKDTGPGIPADQLERLFDRYWQGARVTASAGVGLGLYICKKLVEAHRGRIWVDSHVGKGSCFHFTLPRIVRVGVPEVRSIREPLVLTGRS